MKATIVDTKNASKGTLSMPAQFSEPVRADLIKRAVLAIQANTRQPYGASPMAGMRHSVDLSKRRRDYKGSYGKGISRTPRKTLSRNGSQMFWVGAQAPNTRGGRQAHPPKASKIWDQKINDDERRKAIRCALAASMSKEYVSTRGHKVPAQFPIVLDSDFESVKKTKDFQAALLAIGLESELARSSVVHIRAGRGAMRGRRVRKAVGPLLVVAENCEAKKAARNIPGVDVVTLKNLNVEDLAPGCVPGRLTLFTKSAIKAMEDGKLFM